jgi:hypothetical protein
MIDDLYSAKILTLVANLPRGGRLAAPDATSEKIAKLCGSKITVDVVVENGKIIDYAQDVSACALPRVGWGGPRRPARRRDPGRERHRRGTFRHRVGSGLLARYA